MTEQRPLESFQDGWWGKTRWKDYLSDAFPDEELCTSAGCVAIRDLSSREVVLTLTKSRYSEDKTRKGAKWEILGGHRDPVDPNRPDGRKEPSKKAAAREALEEGGFISDKMIPFAYRTMRNPSAEEQIGPKIYPEEGYYAFYWTQTHSGLVAPTDPKKPLAGTFRADGLVELVDAGHMEEAEYNIVMKGVEAALAYYDFSQL